MLQYLFLPNDSKISNTGNHGIWEMETDRQKSEWSRVCACACMCVWNIWSFWTPYLQGYLYVSVIVKKTEREKSIACGISKKTRRKIDFSLLFVSVAAAMKRLVCYLWLALKPSSRSKGIKTGFLYWYMWLRNIDRRIQIELVSLSSCDHCLHFNLSLGHTTLKCDKYLSWGAKNSRSDCANENILGL